ncbi:DUF1127 domain-containing protein [Neptunicoccus cionae]|uniref:YjiS-like domain-containing protein n=1 Tax=Neptunicoccus cionae TaxID=2035344 RepID=A0A916QV35_9RHOB|nr:DUF1127 domain-containing protein [Amylibacter cionae]GGA13077.1 hypothetical protein GCM10011498_11240 [Amylibacter cionae]
MTSTVTHLPRTACGKRSLLCRIRDALQLRRQRLQLTRLSDAQLRDIGLTRAEAGAEARRRAWDAPNHWQW